MEPKKLDSTLYWSKIGISLLASFLIVFAFFTDIIIAKPSVGTTASFLGVVCDFIIRLRQNIHGYGLIPALALIATSFFCYYCLVGIKIRFSRASLFISILLSVFTVLGLSFYHLGNWGFIFSNTYQILISLLVFVGYSILYYFCTEYIFYLADKHKLSACRLLENTNLGRIYAERSLLINAAVIFICWLPYLVAYYPGSVPHDGLRQLNMYFGESAFLNDHPAFSTFLMGWCMQLGRAVSSDNFGVFVYILLQAILCCVIFAASIRSMGKFKAPIWAQILALAFFALFPVWPAYAQAEIKDTLFTGMVLLNMLQVVAILNDADEYFKKPSNHFILMLSTLMVCLMRNNGIYMILPAALLFFFILKKHNRLFISVSVVVTMLFYGFFTTVVIPSLGIEDGSIKEVLSMPLQQTARYVKYYGDEVTNQERSAIDKIIPYAKIKDKYDPELADPIKDMYRLRATTQDLNNYFKVWGKMLLKHPGTYVQATIHNTYGYFYPGVEIEKMGIFQFYMKGKPIDTGFFAVRYNQVFTSLRLFIENYIYLFREIPVVGYLYSPATYTWMLIFLSALLLRKRQYKNIAALIPCIMIVLGCIGSPVNALVRYMMPVMAAMPVLIAWTLHQTSKEPPQNQPDIVQTRTFRR